MMPLRVYGLNRILFEVMVITNDDQSSGLSKRQITRSYGIEQTDIPCSHALHINKPLLHATSRL